MTLIDTAMVAVMLGCSDRWVRDLVKRGLLSNHGSPRAIRVDIDEVARLIDEGKVRPRAK